MSCHFSNHTHAQVAPIAPSLAWRRGGGSLFVGPFPLRPQPLSTPRLIMGRIARGMGVGARVTVPGKRLVHIKDWALAHVGAAWSTTPVEGTILEMIPPTGSKKTGSAKIKLIPLMGTADEPDMVIIISLGVLSLKAAAEGAAPPAAAAAADTTGAVAMDTEEDHVSREEEERAEAEKLRIAAVEEERRQEVPPPHVAMTWDDWSTEPIKDARALTGAANYPFRLIHSLLNAQSSELDIFHELIPSNLKANMIKATNQTGRRKYGGGWNDIDSHEFDMLIGYWLALGVHHKSRAERWVLAPVHPIFTGYGFGQYGIPRNRFDHIVSALSFVPDKVSTGMEDMRAMQEAFNAHMVEKYSPSWLVCVDESMTPWYYPGDCPAWVIMKDKPTSRGMEFHTTADHSTKVIFRVEPVRDPEATRFQDVCSDRVSALTLRMTEPLFQSYRVVVLDSFFGTLETVLQLEKHGLYSTVVLKKKRSWPTLSNGAELEAKTMDGAVGSVVARTGTVTDTRSGAARTIRVLEVGQRDVSHPVLLLSTWGSTDEFGNRQTRVTINPLTHQKLTLHFFRAHLVHFFFLARHAGDDCNNIRSDKNSLEDVWQTKDWRLRGFAFILSIIEANSCNIFNELRGVKVSLQDFRRSLVQALIPIPAPAAAAPEAPAAAAPGAPAAAAGQGMPWGTCLLVPMPLHTRFMNGRFVTNPAFSKYFSRQCVYCKVRSRKFCTCDPEKIMCHRCFELHHPAN